MAATIVMRLRRRPALMLLLLRRRLLRHLWRRPLRTCLLLWPHLLLWSWLHLRLWLRRWRLLPHLCRALEVRPCPAISTLLEIRPALTAKVRPLLWSWLRL